MNKKIELIELFNRIVKNENIPHKVVIDQEIYTWDKIERLYKDSDRACIGDNAVIDRMLLDDVEILEDEEDNDISSLNAFKLMEAPYMAICLDKNSHEEFMEHLKQSEGEIVHKIGELIEKVNKLDKKINKE